MESRFLGYGRPDVTTTQRELMNRRTGLVGAFCAALTVVLPASAAAQTKTVYEGPPPNAPRILHGPADVDDYFLHQVTIHQGDSVKWINTGFHNVDLPGPSGKDLLLFVFGPTVTGVKDAAGNPFWF